MAGGDGRTPRAPIAGPRPRAVRAGDAERRPGGPFGTEVGPRCPRSVEIGTPGTGDENVRPDDARSEHHDHGCTDDGRRGRGHRLPGPLVRLAGQRPHAPGPPECRDGARRLDAPGLLAEALAALRLRRAAPD